MSIGSIGTMPGSWNPIDGFIGTPVEPLRDTVGQQTRLRHARAHATRACWRWPSRRSCARSANVLMREYLYRWFRGSPVQFQRRPVYRAPPPMPPGKERRLQLDAWNGSPGRDSIESHSGGGSLVAASSTQLVVSGESRHEARMVHQAQEGLLARELAALEAVLGAQGARDERRHVRDARAAELCASVRERILVDELTKSRPRRRQPSALRRAA